MHKKNVARPHRRVFWASGLLALGAAAVSTAVSPGPGQAHAVSAQQMVQAPTRSFRAAILTHRRTVHVTIKSLAFAPKTIVVSPGTKVTWTNQDGFEHTVTSDKGLWNSGPINASSTFARVFKQVGTFTYHCTIHPFMHGTIVVKR